MTKYQFSIRGCVLLRNLAFTAVVIMAFSLQLFSQGLAGIPKENELYRMGYLDIRLMGADPTGKTNSTEAIRKAVALARDNDLVCYFPGGTYLVSDTIRIMRKCVPSGNGWRTDNHQSVLIGEPGNRPLIKLMKGAPNFQDPENPMPVFWLYSMSAYGQQPECEGSTDPLCEQSNINFSQTVRGFTMDLGGNPGAVGIRHAGAQGSTIEDVKIDATGAFAGLYNPPGQAGGIYNIEITGGKYAVYLKKVGRRQQAKFTIMTGCVFRNQEVAVVNVDLSQPMIIAGFHIIKEKGPINVSLPGVGLTMIDGLVELGTGQVIDGTGNIYLQNVYVQGATELANGTRIINPKSLTRFEEYSFCEPVNSTNLINGAMNKETFNAYYEVKNVSAEALGRTLIARHVWNSETYTAFNSPGVVNIKDPVAMKGNEAKGDGTADDTKAIEYAIANFDKVFLPKGSYLVSRTVVLGSKTQFFGAGRTLTSLSSGSNWELGEGTPILSTVSDPNAITSLSDISVRARGRHLEWKAGKKSVVRDVTAGNVVITGNGGGRWYAFMNVGSQLLVDRTTQALRMYATNPERSKDPQWEIRNAENVQLYYVKTEAGTDGHSVMRSLLITDSKNISAYGSTGNVDLKNSGGMSMIEVANSNDVLITHVQPFRGGEGWYSFRERKDNAEVTIDPAMKLALFKRGRTVIDVPHLELNPGN
jgi:hypothetical protein